MTWFAVSFHFGPEIQTSHKVSRLRLASGGLRVSPPPQGAPSAALCWWGRRRRCPLGPRGPGPRAAATSPLRRREAEAPVILPVPLPQRNRWGWGWGAVRFQKAAKPQEGFQLTKSRPHSARAGAWLPSSSSPNTLLPSVHQPLGRDKRPGCGRFLTLFSCKWKPSFRQRGRKANSLGGGAKPFR